VIDQALEENALSEKEWHALSPSVIPPPEARGG
jgi:hypothetical protein